jgi:hypothetical protein
MADKNTAVFGIYPSAAQAERAVDTLTAERFSNNDISVLLPDNQSSKDFAHEKNTKAPEGTATGVATGGTIGGALGLLAGIGALAIPGVGPFIAAGPIMGALAGHGVGGAVGGLVGALVGMGIPEYEAKRYEGRVKDWRCPAVGPLRALRRNHARQGCVEGRGGRYCRDRREERGRLCDHRA